MDPKEGKSHVETDETKSALEHSSREGKEITIPLETNEAGSNLEQNLEEDKDSNDHSENDEADSSSGHKKSSSSLSDSSLGSITVENDMINDAILDSQNGIELGTFPEDADEPLLESMQCSTATQSPPIQTMGRSSGYDPNRIPASVFSSKASTPMDWSVASNESLFSIHVGNSSFSKDQFYLMMGRSGELPRLDEEFDINGLPTETEGADGYSQNDGRDYGSRLMETSGAHTNTVSTGTAEDSKYRMPLRDDVSSSAGSPAAPRFSISRSDDTRASDVSTRSFAFPVLVGDSGKNNSALGETTKHNTQSKRQPESLSGQQLRPETPKSTPKPARWCWFSCFPCCCQKCC